MSEQIKQDSGIPREKEVSVRAYYLWQERGCPIGTPEDDWYRAEQEASQPRPNPAQPPSIKSSAKSARR
jgi:hypothetical protein